MQYPKVLEVKTPLSDYENAEDAPKLIRDVVAQTKFTMLAENILQIDYPTDLVEQVREVNVDDSIYRIDFIYRDTPASVHNCFFPKVPWFSKNFFETGRFAKSQRTVMRNRIKIEYPPIEGAEIVIGRRRFIASRLMPNYRNEYGNVCEECAFGTHCPQGDPFGYYRHCGRVYCMENRMNYLEKCNYNVWVKIRLTEEEANSPLTEDEIYKMKSALAIHGWDDPERDDDGKLCPYRNRFAAEPGSKDHMTFDYLAERGLVDSDYDGQYVWFRVNSRGIRALEKAIGEEIVISEEEE